MGSTALLLFVAMVGSVLHQAGVGATPQSASINIDLHNTKPLAPDLFGIFFEEVR